MSGHCDFCNIWHSGGCSHPGRMLLAMRERELAELQDKYNKLVLAGTFHQDCRPNRQQAEAWLADAQAMNDKWADEVKARRQAETERDAFRDALNEKLADFLNHGDTLTLE